MSIVARTNFADYETSVAKALESKNTEQKIKTNKIKQGTKL
jgi:hypothetical protein